MLMVLAALLGVLVVVGVVRHRAGPRTVASDLGEPVPGQAPVQTEMSYTSRPAGDLFQKALRPGMSVEEKLRRANLTFVSNDHAVLPDGRIRVFGRVQNSGGSSASQARVRVRILLDDGGMAAEGETPLDPSVVPPQGIATFEIPLDYRGPVGTIKAELIWVE